MSTAGTDRDGFSVLRAYVPARERNGEKRPYVSRHGDATQATGRRLAG